MTDTQKILKQNDTIIRLLKEEKGRARWVRASVITELTGWDAQRMRKGREDGTLIYKKGADGFWYDLNQLHSAFIIKKTA